MHGGVDGLGKNVCPAVGLQRLQFGDDRGHSAIRQQGSHAVVSGFRALFPPDGSHDRGYRPRIFTERAWQGPNFRRAGDTGNIDEYFEHRRLARERCLAANPEIGTEIATLYQGKTVPRVQPDSLAGLPKPCAATLANGRGQNAMTMSKLVTL